jgi:hypothetical protein
MVWRIAAVLLFAGTAAAAPLVPPSDQAGRERYRFEPSTARPLHAAEPAGQAAVALGLRPARIAARHAALPAEPELLSRMPSVAHLTFLSVFAASHRQSGTQFVPNLTYAYRRLKLF